MEVDVFNEAGAESVNEGDGTDVELKSYAVKLDSRCRAQGVFDSDAASVRKDFAADNLSRLKKIVLNLLRLVTGTALGKLSLAKKRKIAAWVVSFRMAIFGIEPIYDIYVLSQTPENPICCVMNLLDCRVNSKRTCLYGSLPYSVMNLNRAYFCKVFV